MDCTLIFTPNLFQGVAEFAFCLFFAKLVSYTFLFWLPLYISHSSKSVSKTLTVAVNNTKQVQLFVKMQWQSLHILTINTFWWTVFIMFVAASFNSEKSADLSTMFDVGGIIGKCQVVTWEAFWVQLSHCTFVKHHYIWSTAYFDFHIPDHLQSLVSHAWIEFVIKLSSI